MTVHYLDKPDATIRSIVAAAFPSYAGRKFKLSTDIPDRLDSYWDGGSCDSFAFVQLSTMKVGSVPTNHPVFEPGKPRELDTLPAGLVLVKHSVFCGRDSGITIYVNAAELAPLLPASTGELSDDERAVLYFTRSLKSSYNGVKNYRQQESGLSPERWEAAKQSCIAKGLLNKAGAITATGRNASPARWPLAA